MRASAFQRLVPWLTPRSTRRTLDLVGCAALRTYGFRRGLLDCRPMRTERIPEFVRKHLLDNQPMEEMIFARNPLPLLVNEPEA